jgi:DNA-binding transcriptional LysR family regulator
MVSRAGITGACMGDPPAFDNPDSVHRASTYGIMNLRQIEAFKALMETGTVTLAAARLNISQPAASKLVQTFEHNSGLILFTRDKGRLSPTSEARLLYEEVDRVFLGTERIRSAADEIRSRQRGTLSVGVMPALSVGFAQEVLALMQLNQPTVAVSIQASDTPRLVEQLVTHQIELFFSAHRVEHPEVVLESLATFPLVCIMPNGHRLASSRVIRCRDLAGEPFAALRRESITRIRIDEAFARARVNLNIAMESPMAPTICAFVARGLGVSIVDPLYVGSFAPALVVRPLEVGIRSEVYLARPRLRKLSVIAASFAQTARDYVASLQGKRSGKGVGRD